MFFACIVHSHSLFHSLRFTSQLTVAVSRCLCRYRDSSALLPMLLFAFDLTYGAPWASLRVVGCASFIRLTRGGDRCLCSRVGTSEYHFARMTTCSCDCNWSCNCCLLELLLCECSSGHPYFSSAQYFCASVRLSFCRLEIAVLLQIVFVDECYKDVLPVLAS